MGSTRWEWHWKATTVEACFSIDAAEMKHGGFFELPMGAREQGGPYGRAWPWIEWIERAPEACIICYHPRLRFWPDRPVLQEIDLTTTQPHFGGVRYWLTCPECEARCRKLYLPPGCKDYLCRTCHELTYRSCQLSHFDEAKWHTAEASRKRKERLLEEHRRMVERLDGKWG